MEITTEKLLREIEIMKQMLHKLLEIHQPKWISEPDAMALMHRSKVWLKRQRLGYKDIPATLMVDFDWRYLNGRTPEYKMSSINELKRRMIKVKVPRKKLKEERMQRIEEW